MDIQNMLNELIDLVEIRDWKLFNGRNYSDEDEKIKIVQNKIITYIEKLEAQSYDGLGDDL